MLEAAVPVAGTAGSLGIRLVEVLEDGGDGRVQAVEIEAVEADFPDRIAGAIVVLPEPGHELENVGVAPHPGGEPLEVAQGLDRLGVFADAANVPVDAIRIGPIRFGATVPPLNSRKTEARPLDGTSEAMSI